MSVRSCLTAAGFDAEDMKVFKENFDTGKKTAEESTKEALSALAAVELNVKSDYIYLTKKLADANTTLRLPPIAAKVETKKKAVKKDKLVAKDEARREDLAEPVTADEQVVAKDEVEVSDRQEEQLDGWYNEQLELDVEYTDYAEANPAVLKAAERIELEEDIPFREAAIQAVERHKAAATKESIVDVSPAEQARRDALSKELNKPQPEKSTVKGVKEEIKDRWGVSFKNIHVVQDVSELTEESGSVGTSAQAFYNPNTKQIYIIANRVNKGEVKDLILHEKGVHELLKASPEYQDVVKNMKRLWDANDRDVRQAYVVAMKAVEKKALFDKDRQELMDEEAIAYLMNRTEAGTTFNRVVRSFKKFMRETFGLEMTTTDIVELVNSMVEEQAITGEETKADIKPSPVRESVAEDVELVTGGYRDTSTNWMKQLDITGRMSDVLDKARVVGLGFIPTRPLYDMLDRVLPEGVKISDVQQWHSKASSAADRRIEALDDQLLKPFYEYQRTNNEEYKKVVDMMLSATLNNKDAEGSVEFRTMSPTGQKMYTQVRDHYKMMRKDKLDALRTYTNALDVDPKQRKEMLDILGELESEALKEKVYFPFNRFGAFRVEGTMPNGLAYVTHHDTKREAETAMARRRGAGWDLKVTKVQSYGQDAGLIMTPEAFTRAQRFVKEVSGDAKGTEQAQEALWRTFLEYSPQQALKRGMAKRRNVAGMSTDMIRGLAQSIHRDIRTNERLRVKPEIDKIFAKVSQAIKEMPDNNIEATELMNELRDNQGTSYRADWSKNITKFNFGYYLGFNPSTALINLTQLGIMTMPVLSADYKFRAIKVVNSEFKHVMSNILDHKTFGYKDIDLKALNALKDRNVINVTQAHMMTGINEGHSASYEPSKYGDLFVQGMAGMFHYAEVVNRVTTAMSAFKLKYEETNDFDLAVQYADNITYETQFGYEETDKSRFQRSDVGNVLLAMKTYSISMAVHMTRNFNRWLFDAKATPEEKKQAKLKFLGTMIATTTIGGTGALPFTGMIPEIFAMLFGYDDDPEEVIREALYETFGETTGNVILDGLLGTATQLDLQSRVNIGLDGFARLQGGQSSEDMYEALITGTLGPVGGMVSKFTKGLDQIDDGKMTTGLTTMMPIALKNVLKAGGSYAQGAATTSYDSKIEDFDEKDALFKALGFNSAEYSAYFREGGYERRAEEALRSDKRMLLREMSYSIIQGSASEKRAARLAIREFNRTKPRTEQITQSTIKRAVKALRKKLEGEGVE